MYVHRTQEQLAIIQANKEALELQLMEDQPEIMEFGPTQDKDKPEIQSRIWTK